MPLYTKDSLEMLKSRVDLVEVVSSLIDLKRTGSSYKARCPFHDEKSPSFTLQPGDTHYHCYGCGAHGDAIQFLIEYQKLSFMEAVEYLATRFQVPLKPIIKEDKEQQNHSKLKEAGEAASRFFHFILLYTKEGHEALNYLYNRGINLAFIRYFQVGLAPKEPFLFRKYMHSLKFSDEILQQAALIALSKRGDFRDFFSDRITFPIRNLFGHCIGFSARKYKEETFGGKYINSSETPIFKKSSVLFGLNYSRRRIAKEQQVIIVEGQIDALRLIQEGFNITVATLGTAFNEQHVKELLALGVKKVFLALDSDKAGQEAALKIGDYFQKEAVQVLVASMDKGKDPDDVLKEEGAIGFMNLLENSQDYLTFLIKRKSLDKDLASPAVKSYLVQELSSIIKSWKHKVLVHESLKKMCRILELPEISIALEEAPSQSMAHKWTESLGVKNLPADFVMEMDLLRLLLAAKQQEKPFVECVKKYLDIAVFKKEETKKLYHSYMTLFEEKQNVDLLSLLIEMEDEASQVFLSELLSKKINKEKIGENILLCLKKLQEREWMQRREEIRLRLLNENLSDDKALELAKEFDQLKKNPPVIENEKELLALCKKSDH